MVTFQLSTKLMILSEDTHGARFFKELFNRMKNEHKVSKSLHANAERFFGPCNQKLERQMKPMSNDRGYNHFIIAADADGGSLDKLKNRIEIHVPNEMKVFTRYLVFTTEVEEWICISLGIRINDKPSVILRNRFEYEKFRLADYVQKLDFRKLKKCPSFRDFAAYLGEIDPEAKSAIY
jgi:hypothetical protein